ncbi:MAG: DNA-directed RNA polymerase subunit beta' [Candidatus Nealsonbacteria bacterium CG_4_8_14_3_um_filter_39_7]|nr:MAG: DNA-directed RNA polymerase subunit beta' [Candidatus Nealsonbacteria bacterium CG_4_8_14_3_um_filter_39_7]
MRVEDLEAIRIKIASPEDILGWSHGEVTKPETINYRTQRAEKDGLFCEKIFGPEKDFECYCGKYKRIRYKGLVCDRCGVEVTKSSVRRERMGHIKLATPLSHIWFLRGIPSMMGQVLDLPMQLLEKVVYFASYVVIDVNEEARNGILEEIEREYKMKSKAQMSNVKSSAKTDKDKDKNKDEETDERIKDLKDARDRAREELLALRPLRIISEIEYHNLSMKYGEVFSAGTGAETLRKIFEKIDLKKETDKLKEEVKTSVTLEKKKNLRRLKLFQGMLVSGVRPEWMFLTVLPVLPPDLRPMVQLDGGRYASSDLNDLYRRVINRNNRLKYLLDINAPEVIVRNEKRMLQEAVDALIDNGMRKGTMTQASTGGRRLLKSLADILKGKQGRFRRNLLGKRVDYSARSVIVVGPDLKMNQVGLPKTMALELFKPFVIHKILERELAYNVRGASRLIEKQIDDVWEILEEIVKDKLVLLNRAPTLHRLGIQAFYPLLIEGKAIRLHPLVCKAFNADFDGDQMPVHLPLSDKAQAEARDRMVADHNLLKPATGLPVVSLNQDIVLGCYWMTKIKEGEKGEGKVFGSFNEAIMAYEFGEVDLKAKIKCRVTDLPEKKRESLEGAQFIETCIGRILFNEKLPEDYAFQNKLIKNKDLEKIAGEVIAGGDYEVIERTLDQVKNLGYEFATRSGTTWGMDDLVALPEKEGVMKLAEKEVEQTEGHFKSGFLTREEKAGKVIEIWTKTKTKIEELVRKSLPQDGPIFRMVDSGARGAWSQSVQMGGMKGLVINPSGQIIELPIKSSLKEGFDVLEYFISTHGARKGTVDTALRTSTAGYLTRRLVDVAHEVVTFDADCGDDKGIEVFRKNADEIGQNFIFKIVGRVCLENIKGICEKGEIIDWKKGQKIIEANIEKVKVRSPLSCKSVHGICQQCYGWDLASNILVERGEAVGIIAAQSIGEPGTQLTMRTFHTGGVAGGGDITSGLPRVQEIFESRIPRGKAVICLSEGKIEKITPEGVIEVKVKNQEESKEEDDDSEVKETKKSSKKEKAGKTEIMKYEIPLRAKALVKVGDEVKKGQSLSEGNFDLKEFFKLNNQEDTQKYIVNEIQKIYVSQGALIHDKHPEIIVRQMFSRVKIKDSGDSYFVTGEVIEKAKFLHQNAILKEEGKKPATAKTILLGISRVSLTTDSFLSASSFQETSRVLIRAAAEGKTDDLIGLKENVIIGKLIPAGTGFKQ